MATEEKLAFPYRGTEHEPFLWAGTDQRAALLLHGFPGTPAEMRGLGSLLHDEGWTVYSPLLPGFGPDIATLARRHYREWLDAAAKAYEELRANHKTILLVGNSMGGALAINVAQSAGVTGLILIAPFTRFAVAWQRIAWPLVSCFVSQLLPFQKADLSSPEILRLVRRMWAGVDINDPTVQAMIRKIAVPTRALEQVRQVGATALRAAPSLRIPTLILQGRYDLVVRPKTTRVLKKRMAISPQFHEFDAGHDLLETDQPPWPQVSACVKDFARSIEAKATGGHDRPAT